MTTEADQKYMTLALAQAKLGKTMFGAVLVHAGKISGEAYNTVSQTVDPSAHAELNLIRNYCRAQKVTKLSGLALYTTAEPCPMCAALCAFTGISEIVFGVSIADLVNLGTPQRELSCQAVVSRGQAAVTIRGGVFKEECLAHCKALSERNG